MQMRFLTQKIAQEIDVRLMSEEGAFSIDQLMELAGLSVATAVCQIYKPQNRLNPLICCGLAFG
jgi:NAD(P)H-hydrate epimerase